MITYAAVAVFAVSYVLIASEKVHRVAAALAGVAGLTLLGLVNADTAFFSRHTGIDWNVVFLLFGMMVIVSVLTHTGLFECIALWAARTSRGRPTRLMVLLILVTAVFSPILDNVTTALLVTPVALSVTDRLGLSPRPYLIAIILAANVGGASTLIGDPPNIIIASRAGLTFDDFLIHSLPLTVIELFVLVGLLRLMFYKQLRRRPEAVELQELDPLGAVHDRPLLIRCLVVLGLVMVAFSLHAWWHIDPSIIAMLGAGAMVVVSGTTPKQFLGDVEWMTLAFFMALFVLVGGLVQVGVIDTAGQWAAAAMRGDELLGVTGLLVGSAVVGALVDNIPYTTAMAPIVEEMVASTGVGGADSPLWWAFVFGADFGGNTTAVAAGANVVVLGIAAKAGRAISFWQFTRFGLITVAVTIAVAWLYVWLRYFVWA